MSKPDQTALTPRLRFPEFRAAGAWQQPRLDEIADRVTEKAGGKQLTTLSISAGLGFVSQAEKFSRDISGKQYDHYICVRRGDFSYNKGNSNLFPQGCIYELKAYEEAAVPNAFISFRFRAHVVPSFYKGYFDNNFHGKQLAKFITSGARSDGLLNINPSDFFGIILPTPSKASEQRKVADCLAALDALIAAEEEKLAALKAHRQGLLWKLFPADGKAVPEWRFPAFRGSGAWRKSTIGKACDTFSGGTPDTGNQAYYGGAIPFIRSGEIDKSVTKLSITRAGLDHSAARMARKDDVLVALYGANSGEVALSKMEGAINQAILCLRHKTSNAFVYHYLSRKKGWIISTYLQGGQGNLSGEIIKSIALHFPKPAEQRKIADCLSAMDALLAAQAGKIETLRLHKKGLMQGLFPAIEEAAE